MSSFVIGKEDYIKAAGLMAGIQKIKKDSFYIYDSDFGGVITGGAFYRVFNKFFEYNCISVYEQYAPRHEDMVMYSDDNDYIEVFRKYIKIGVNITITGGSAFHKLLMELYQFFNSISYQIEKEDFNYKIEAFINNFINAFIYELSGIGRDSLYSWGSLDISKIKYDEYESLFDGVLLMKK